MAEDPKAPEASAATSAGTGDASVELPASRDGKCPTCNEWLYFEAATKTRPACFRCKKCGTLYRGAPEWSAKSELGPAGPTRPFSPPGYNPGAPTPDPPMPSWYRRRKR